MTLGTKSLPTLPRRAAWCHLEVLLHKRMAVMMGAGPPEGSLAASRSASLKSGQDQRIRKRFPRFWPLPSYRDSTGGSPQAGRCAPVRWSNTASCPPHSPLLLELLGRKKPLGLAALTLTLKAWPAEEGTGSTGRSLSGYFVPPPPALFSISQLPWSGKKWGRQCTN